MSTAAISHTPLQRLLAEEKLTKNDVLRLDSKGSLKLVKETTFTKIERFFKPHLYREDKIAIAFAGLAASEKEGKSALKNLDAYKKFKTHVERNIPQPTYERPLTSSEKASKVALRILSPNLNAENLKHRRVVYSFWNPDPIRINNLDAFWKGYSGRYFPFKNSGDNRSDVWVQGDSSMFKYLETTRWDFVDQRDDANYSLKTDLGGNLQVTSGWSAKIDRYLKPALYQMDKVALAFVEIAANHKNGASIIKGSEVYKAYRKKTDIAFQKIKLKEEADLTLPEKATLKAHRIFTEAFGDSAVTPSTEERPSS